MIKITAASLRQKRIAIKLLEQAVALRYGSAFKVTGVDRGVGAALGMYIKHHGLSGKMLATERKGTLFLHKLDKKWWRGRRVFNVVLNWKYNKFAAWPTSTK